MQASTGYARLNPRQARVVLATIFVAVTAAVAVTLSPLGSTNLVPSRKQTSDVELYRATVDRVHRGEGYYQAIATELSSRGYPMRSVFNWRMPLPIWLLGKMPSVELGKALLGVLALTLLLAAFEAMAREEEAAALGAGSATYSTTPTSQEGKSFPWRAIGCTVLLTGALLPTVLGDLFTLPVLWAGVAIALSLCAYALHYSALGVLLGLTALFFRELSLPYCILCLALAWQQQNRRECLGWLIGLVAWFAFLSLHCWNVCGLIPANAHAHAQSWIRFSGAGFVISTAQMNAYLLPLPQWITAIYLLAALVGAAGWNTPFGTRLGLTLCLFLASFAVVGHSFNQYWGCMIAPLLCFAAARFPVSMRELWRAAKFSRS